ncbi:hypothetical protein [Salinibacterium sp. M195]|uniref:hypothetical protein n=1 Tax=Salinibacterium sp. M195 TaxID=2583374 RepID=UPI001C6287B6|nr:hypothetical protein [Salinibacterium sp. M195]QYH37034.1 hypothetical protein FFT87_14460 [Salinibacterium sp. M195]
MGVIGRGGSRCVEHGENPSTVDEMTATGLSITLIAVGVLDVARRQRRSRVGWEPTGAEEPHPR